MSKTLKDLVKEAINVQDACNLSGVVHSFSRALTELRTIFPGIGTNELNTHPIVVLFADKIQSLSGAEIGFSQAWDACNKLAE